MITCVIDKKYHLLCGKVLDVFKDRIRYDRTWFTGMDEKDKKGSDNIIMLVDANIVDLTDEEFQTKVNEVKAIWDANMTRVLKEREEYFGTQLFNWQGDTR